ncbi:hypothetical protein [Natrarchaeobius chitinivorans]|uniref:hypothetical protein n=1 Tax=Natrarchaeobius chitinivorans TaxID=1679083 RepID=UPI000F5457A5|nr:hypothetical protein [Natrarchaeobius chitinivorans]
MLSKGIDRIALDDRFVGPFTTLVRARIPRTAGTTTVVISRRAATTPTVVLPSSIPNAVPAKTTLRTIDRAVNPARAPRGALTTAVHVGRLRYHAENSILYRRRRLKYYFLIIFVSFLVGYSSHWKSMHT